MITKLTDQEIIKFNWNFWIIGKEKSLTALKNKSEKVLKFFWIVVTENQEALMNRCELTRIVDSVRPFESFVELAY